MSDAKHETIAGIDLGTTNSVIAVFKGGRPEVAENPEGNRTTPSVVLMDKKGPIVGETAESMMALQPDRYVKEVKRMMGDGVAAFTDPDSGKDHSPVQISSIIIRHLVEYAQEYFGCDIDAAVITVPAYFKDVQREATKQAGEQAGVVVPEVINEPTAALRAYCYGKRYGLEDGTYIMIDLGGGTQDATVAVVSGDEIKIAATCGDPRLGGTDFTLKINELVLNQLKDEAGVELNPEDPSEAAELQSIWQKCEIGKKQLSKVDKTIINIMAKGGQVTRELSRSEFEDMPRGKMDEICKNCTEAINQAGLSPEKLDGVVFVGGATRMPMVNNMVEELCGKDVPVFKDISTDLAVACGAAIRGYQLSNKAGGVIPVKKMSEAASFDIGVVTKEPEDPDPNRLIIRRIIASGSEIPCEVSKTFGLQSNEGGARGSARLIVAEGADGQEYSEGSDKIQEFSLDDLPGSDNPRKERLEVTLKVDQSGIISCRAVDLETGKEIERNVDRKAL